MTKGMIVNIFRTDRQDCSNGGISSKFDRALLIGEGIPEIFEDADLPKIVLEKGNLQGTVKAMLADTGGKWSMFGGCFVHSSDSRFSEAVERITGSKFYDAVALHDRFE